MLVRAAASRLARSAVLRQRHSRGLLAAAACSPPMPAASAADLLGRVPLVGFRDGFAAPGSLVGKGLILRRYYSPSQSSQINQGEFTEMSWEAIIGAIDAARMSKQQVVETEHLMKALLEQKDGLARRILAKAGVDNTAVLQATDQFISSQPKISGDISGPVVGQNLISLLNNAKKHKKDFGDDFVSVEHFMEAFCSDKRFGQQLLKNFNLTEKELKDAVLAVRGSHRVTDQSTEP